MAGAVAQPRRILVRGVNWLGDAVMTSPALLRLREALPQAQITLLTPAKLAQLWWQHPAVNDRIEFSPGESVWAIARRIRAGHFDTALILPNSPRSALEAWLGGIPRRIGYASSWRRWLLTEAVPARPGYVAMRKRSPAAVRRLVAGEPVLSGSAARVAERWGASAHHLHQYLHLVAQLGASAEPVPPRIQVDEKEAQEAGERFGLPPGWTAARWAGLNAGAEYGPAKRWPAERFVSAARRVQQAVDCRWVILGGTRDVELAASLVRGWGSEARDRGPVNLAGRTTLRELAAVLRGCGVLLTNDTGPMHLAAAVGTPVVALFGSTSADLTGPGMPGDGRHRLLVGRAGCAPCFLRECPVDLRCLRSIEVEEVVAAVREVLVGGRVSSGPSR